MFGAASLDAFANVKNYQTIAPVSEISEAILDLQIVEVTTDNFAIAATGCNCCSHLARDFPARYFFRILHVGKIDNTHRTSRIVGQVNIVTVDKSTMNAAGDRFGVFGNWLRMRGIGSVEKS